MSQLIDNVKVSNGSALWIAIACFTIFVVTIPLHFYAQEIEQERQLIQERKVLRLLSTNLQEDILKSITDIKILQQRINLYNQEPSLAANRQQYIETLLMEFMQLNHNYYKIQLINPIGQELIHIEHKDDQIQNSFGQRLENRNDLSIFKQAIYSPADTVHISRFELNHIGKKIEQPFRPIIQFSMAIRDRSGTFIGAILLAFNGQHFFNHIKNIDEAISGTFSFVNSEGLWLFSQDDEEANEIRTDKLGTVWPMPVTGNPGVALGNDKVYLYDLINYNLIAEKLPNIKLSLHEPFFKIIYTIPQSNLIPHSIERLQWAGPLTITLLIIGFLATYWWRRLRHRQHETTAQLGRLAQIIEESQEIICLTDERGIISYVNPTFENVTGYKGSECIGRAVSLLKSGYHDDAFYSRLWRQLNAGKHFQSIFVNRRKDGSIYYEEKFITPFKSRSDGHKTYFFSSGRDITEINRLKNRTKQLTYLAFHDSLTGLANRALLHERISHCLSSRREWFTALLMLDLDGFKAVNDQHGHPAGDKLLAEVARRIRADLREGDTVARVGGDEFALLLEQIKSTEDVEHVAKNLLAAIATPIEVEKNSLTVSVSIGIALIDKNKYEVDDIIALADKALYQAKEAGRNCYVILDSAAE